jgi:hypothetical protein
VIDFVNAARFIPATVLSEPVVINAADNHLEMPIISYFIATRGFPSFPQ